jgi:nucleoside-diphosphate-sugar epimerase
VFRKRLRLHPFVRAKTLVEDSVFAAQKAERVRATVLRVGVVFGRADRRTLPGIFAGFMRKPGWLPGQGRNRVAVIAASDLAQAAVDALETPHSRGGTYELAHPQQPTLAELTELIAQTAGVEPPWLNVPRPLLRVAAYAGNLAHQTLRMSGPPPYDPGLADLLAADFPVSCERARAVLDFAPRVSLRKMIEEDVHWHRKRRNTQLQTHAFAH